LRVAIVDANEQTNEFISFEKIKKFSKNEFVDFKKSK
jgi:hypothetical protein